MGSRSPLGERGLKFSYLQNLNCCDKSLSAWRAWIEIKPTYRTVDFASRRSPLGERGLKFDWRSWNWENLWVALRLESVD